MTQPRSLPRIITRKFNAPAAGAELVIASDSGAGWLIRSMSALFTASAAVANRTFAVTADQDGGIFFASALGVTVTAGNNVRLSGYAGSSGTASSGPVAGFGLPADGLWLPQGSALRTVTALIDAGDTYTSVAIQYFEFPTGDGLVLRPLVATIEFES